MTSTTWGNMNPQKLRLFTTVLMHLACTRTYIYAKNYQNFLQYIVVDAACIISCCIVVVLPSVL